LRAPAGDGEVLAVPPLEQAGDIVGLNRARLAAGPDLLGRPFAEVRELARRELAPRQGGPLFLAGHQPELFHPGVWVKNFALAGPARRHGGDAVNLVVDNDTMKSASLRVPVAGERVRLRPVPFDRAGPELPWEERHVLDRATCDAFGEAAASIMRRWGFKPILTGLWPEVCRRSLDAPIGEAFAAGRRLIERNWGCDNLEAPLSAVSRGQGFAHFVGAMLADVERFHSLYNAVVRAHRARRHIRSRNHPVPDLAAEGGWLEVPLWGWRAGSARRGRLFVRPEVGRLRVRAADEPWPDLPPPGDRDFVAAWRGLGAGGYKARPRALTTTLFARLLLADVFIHGIGGAVYDELTDELMRRFFGVTPPAFVVLSGTRWLPLGGGGDTIEDRRRLARLLRDLEHNPQRHLAPGDETAGLMSERREWVQQRPTTRAGRRERFLRLRELTERLAAFLDGRRDDLRAELAALDDRLAADAILRRRDYSFCLYPESVLRPFCTQFL
jgi:hypothetical protein